MATDNILSIFLVPGFKRIPVYLTPGFPALTGNRKAIVRP